MKRSASMAGGVAKPRKEDGGGGEEERGGHNKVITTGDKIGIIILCTVFRRVS